MTLSRRRYLRSDLYSLVFIFFFFFFNDTATTEIYTLSLHDALPISHRLGHEPRVLPGEAKGGDRRSEEHTSELQSRENLVCRLLLEKKKKQSYSVVTSQKKQIQQSKTRHVARR